MASEPSAEEFQDDISINSTDDGNGGSEEELFVTQILAERKVNGESVCLIEWQDFPLAEATWEPKENLSDGLMAAWEQTKTNQRKGLKPKFNIQKWKEATLQNYESRHARHRLRNLARERRGLPQTTWTKTFHQTLKDLACFPNDEDETDQADTSLTEQDLRQSRLDDNASSPINQLENGISEASAELLANSPQRAVRETFSGTPVGRGVVSPAEEVSLAHPGDVRSTSEDVEIIIRSTIKVPIQSSNNTYELPRRPSLPPRPPAVGSTRAAGYANVFAGGRTRKGRGNLRKAAVNPEKSPKILNARLQRLLELQSRDNEGINPPALRPSELISLDHNNPQATIREQLAVNNAADDAPTNEASKTKKNGIVQWEDEPMEIDPNDSLFVSEQPPLPPRDNSGREEEEAEVSVVNKEQPKDPATISKTVQLGPDGQNTVTLSFEGVPPSTSSAWASQFCSDDRLIFTHTCTTQDFLSQMSTDVSRSIVQLCKGTALSFTENDFLSNLVKNLRLGSLMLLCCNENYIVMMFSNAQTAQESEKITLEFTIYGPHNFLGPSMLAPTPQLRIPDKRDRSSAIYSRPLDDIFGQRYEELLPHDAKNAEKHNFFLAFPLRAKQEAALLSQWLRMCHGSSDIRTSYCDGHWSSFSDLSHGVVIIHEDVLWSIRLFPKLNALLHGRRGKFNFWMFGRSLVPVPSFDSEDSLVSPSGNIHLQRVFDPGAAYLITPSFFISEPEQAYTFLKWFWNLHVKNVDMSRPSKLVLCAKVDEWIYNLISEKAVLRHKFPSTASEDELNASGISDKAIECRSKTLRLLQQLIEDATYERTNRIVIAPASIDGNDEQSLVNWFGYWSTLNIDRFRRYTVIGSGWQTEVRLSRILRTPNYSKSIMNDPDGVQSDLPSQPEPSSVTSSLARRSNREDESFSIAHQLTEAVRDQRRDWSPVKVFWYPVGYSTSDVSFRLGDIISKYYTYDQWFNFFWRDYGKTSMNKHSRNTYAGLFYTLDEDKASQCGLNNVQRSPWVVIFRAVSPHIRPWKSSEIFIWDMRYSEMINEGKNLCYSDLLEAQQRLIENIQEKTKDVVPLEKVWVGAFGARTSLTAAIDVTVQWIDTLLGKVRDWIPAPPREIPHRGWSLATPERLLADDRSYKTATDIDVTKASPQFEDDTSPPKIIFHPPSGHGQNQYTKCRNRLYRRAREVDPRLEGANFEYIFRPTMDWYKEQCDEGRGFEHIKVLPWREVFQLYKVVEFLRKRD
ncbi:hypothetical protein ACHAQJ_010535 [Trichoderma viride]